MQNFGSTVFDAASLLPQMTKRCKLHKQSTTEKIKEQVKYLSSSNVYTLSHPVRCMCAHKRALCSEILALLFSHLEAMLAYARC